MASENAEVQKGHYGPTPPTRKPEQDHGNSVIQKEWKKPTLYVKYHGNLERTVPPLRETKIAESRKWKESPTFIGGRPKELGKEKPIFEPMLVRRLVKLNSWR